MGVVADQQEQFFNQVIPKSWVYCYVSTNPTSLLSQANLEISARTHTRKRAEIDLAMVPITIAATKCANDAERVNFLLILLIQRLDKERKFSCLCEDF